MAGVRVQRMRKLACPRCGTHVMVAEGESPVCPSCGHGAPPGGPPQHAAAPEPQTQHAPEDAARPWYEGSSQADGWRTVPGDGSYAQPARQAPSEGIAIAALLINILLLPGVGTLIGGRTGEGVGQLVLCLVGIVLTIIIVGIFLIVAAWIWALVSGIQLLQEAREASVASGYRH